jgi:uncharacterized protein (TIRG00374 family)
MVVALGTVTLVLRACRWRILLNAEAAVSLPTAFWATAAGYFGNNFLPARAGELVRTFMISSRCALDSAYVLATALSERVADAVALVVISAIVLLILPAQTGWLARAARPFAILGLLGALAIAIVPLLESAVRSVIERLPLPPALRLKVTTAMAHALRGMRAFHDARRLSGFVALTALIWSVDAVGLVVTGSAIGLQLPILVAFLLMTALGLSSALPAMPGYVGIYQFVAVMVLTPFGFGRTDAIAYILVAQALGYVLIGFWGSIGLWRYRRTRAAVRDMTGEP